jgi:hypothetical protein
MVNGMVCNSEPERSAGEESNPPAQNSFRDAPGGPDERRSRYFGSGDAEICMRCAKMNAKRE